MALDHGPQVTDRDEESPEPLPHEMEDQPLENRASRDGHHRLWYRVRQRLQSFSLAPGDQDHAIGPFARGQEIPQQMQRARMRSSTSFLPALDSTAVNDRRMAAARQRLVGRAPLRIALRMSRSV